MQNTVEYTGANKRVSPATVELLIRERSKGKTIRKLAQAFSEGGDHQRMVIEDELLTLAGYRS